MVKWLGEFLSLIATLFGAPPVIGTPSDKAVNDSRKRILEAWDAKHGSKRNKTD